MRYNVIYKDVDLNDDAESWSQIESDEVSFKDQYIIVERENDSLYIPYYRLAYVTKEHSHGNDG